MTSALLVLIFAGVFDIARTLRRQSRGQYTGYITWSQHWRKDER